MPKLLRILILLVLSFSLNAEEIFTNPPLDKPIIENDVAKLQANYVVIRDDITALNHQMSVSIDSNLNLIEESNALIYEVKKLIQSQNVQRKNILNVMDSVKEIKDSKADLSLSIASDKMAIKWNFWSAVIIAIGSITVTILVLKLSLSSETKKQTRSLANNLAETKVLNENQIATQLEIARQQNERVSEDLEAKISMSNAQLKTQLDSVSEQTKEAHLLKIDEFRQAWINTFREDISVLLKSFITLKDFHSVEEGFFIAWDILKRAERRQRSVYDEFLNQAEQETEILDRVRTKLRINDDDDYIESLKYASSAKKKFEQYKNEFREFNKLHATIIEQKTKIMLMFNPNGTVGEKKVVAKLNYIHQLLSIGDRTFMPKGNKEAIDKAVIDLQPLVQDMLKIEWNRVRRVEPF